MTKRARNRRSSSCSSRAWAYSGSERMMGTLLPAPGTAINTPWRTPPVPPILLGTHPVEPGNNMIALYRLKDSGIDPGRFEREVAEMAADPDVQRELGRAGGQRQQS